MIASQMPMVRHGWVALLRARRSVNEAVRPRGLAVSVGSIGSPLSGREPSLVGALYGHEWPYATACDNSSQ